MDIITKEEAKAKGLKYYFTGKECKHGHISKRTVWSGTCYTCVNNRNREQYRKKSKDKEWRKRNLIMAVKNRARRNGLEFNLTVDSIEWPEVCPVLGIELNYFAGCDREGRWNGVSIDRRDPKGGYTIDNVAVLSMRANDVKKDCTVEEMEKVLEYMKKA